MKRLAWFAMVAVMGWMLTGGSTGFTAPPKKAPAKHGGGKPAHSGAKHESKPKPHEPHKGGGKSGNEKEKENGKSKQEAHEEHNTKKLAESKSKENSHDHHEDLHHHGHEDHKTVKHEIVENKSVTVNKPIGASVSGGTPGAVVAGDAGVADAAVMNAAGPSLSGRPRMVFSFNVPEGDRYDAAARAAEVSRDEWIRSRLNAALSRELK